MLFETALAEYTAEGTVNQFLGDGFMALSGRPRPRGSRGARRSPRSGQARDQPVVIEGAGFR
jgi:class 3 adenylate cyclase